MAISLKQTASSAVARATPPGSSPGLLVTRPDIHHPTIARATGYGPEGSEAFLFTGIDELRGLMERWPQVWLDIDGLADIALIEAIGKLFELDRLMLEDVLDVQHRSKIEKHDDYMFIIFKLSVMESHFATEQVSMMLNDRVLITFQEKQGDSFKLVHERLRRANGNMRKMGIDYLAYALLDAAVDGYYPILDNTHLRLDALEHTTINAGGGDTIHQIHHIKNDLLLLHHSIWPMRDIVGILMRGDCPYINAQTLPYLRDCYDHSIQITELSEFYRSVAADLMHTFVAYSGHKMNEVVKVLTLISAIFIPLSFIAGVYGMNFDTASPYNMPELHWEMGYPFALGLMAATALFMVSMFLHRGWIGGNGR